MDISTGGGAAGGSSGPVQFIKNSSTVTVTQDTVTPANSVPLPIAQLNTAGVAIDPATSTKQSDGTQKTQVVDATGNVQPAGDTVARGQFVRPTDGTNSQGYTAAGEAKVSVTQPLVAGSAIIGKVGIDQTTPGTTNGVQVNAALPAGANSIGSVGLNAGSNTIGKVDQGVAGTAANGWFAKVTDGTNTQAVKAASTAASATDPAAVVALSPNSLYATSTKQSDGTQKTQLVSGAGNVAAVDTAGNQYGVISSPNGVAAGLMSQFSIDSRLSVQTQTTAIFSDPFDGGTLDTTNRWNAATTAGGITVTLPGSGILQFNGNTTASANAVLSTQPTFVPSGFNFMGSGFAVQLEAAPITNIERFWGFGTTGSSYAAPLTNAYGFELVGSVLQAVVYSAGTKVFSQTLTTPTDGLQHRYAVVNGQAVISFYIDNYTVNFELPVGTTQIFPAVETQPVLIQIYNNSAAPASAPTFKLSGVAVADYGQNAQSIADGTYKWRKATVSAAGSLSVTAGTPSGTITDRSGTCSGTPLTATTLAAINANRKYLFVMNNSTAGDIYINFTTAATATNSIVLKPFATYEMNGNFVSTELISVASNVASATYSAKEA